MQRLSLDENRQVSLARLQVESITESQQQFNSCPEKENDLKEVRNKMDNSNLAECYRHFKMLINAESVNRKLKHLIV